MIFSKSLPLLARSFLIASISYLYTATTQAAAEFDTPVNDEKGSWTSKINPSLPNVLLLGDSISIGYTRGVQRLLEERANVLRPMKAADKPANCGDTQAGVKSLDRWLGDTNWSVIHFNWGLWDICYRNPSAKISGNRDKLHGRLSVLPDQYAKNLEEIVARLQKTGAKLIWAATTQVPENEPGRFVGDDIKYNEIAAAIMRKNGIEIDDLHSLTSDFSQDLFSGKGNVHYTPEGYRLIAIQVAESVARNLPTDNASK